MSAIVKLVGVQDEQGREFIYRRSRFWAPSLMADGSRRPGWPRPFKFSRRRTGFTAGRITGRAHGQRWPRMTPALRRKGAW